MWRFTVADECRFDTLMGYSHEGIGGEASLKRASHRLYLLSAASRFCKWRDGDDSRRDLLTGNEASQVEKELVRGLVRQVTPAARK
jgi:hypothetical protein